jgi:hypothetical protein
MSKLINNNVKDELLPVNKQKKREAGFMKSMMIKYLLLKQSVIAQW